LRFGDPCGFTAAFSMAWTIRDLVFASRRSRNLRARWWRRISGMHLELRKRVADGSEVGFGGLPPTGIAVPAAVPTG